MTGWSGGHPGSAALLRNLLGEGSAHAAAEAAELYKNIGSDDLAREYFITNDQSWAAPSQALADAHAYAGNPTYQYEFTRRSTALDGRVGAAHLAEIPFFWGNLDAPGVADLLGDDVLTDPALGRLADQVSGTIAQFVKTGTPDGGPLGAWKQTSEDDRTTMVIGVESYLEHNRNGERIAFWRNHASAPALSTVTGTD